VEEEEEEEEGIPLKSHRESGLGLASWRRIVAFYSTLNIISAPLAVFAVRHFL
jgi:hypothetical protein